MAGGKALPAAAVGKAQLAMMQRVGRMVMNNALNGGYRAWREIYIENCEQMAFMKQVGAKIVMRGQSLAFAQWREVYLEDKATKDTDIIAITGCTSGTGLTLALACAELKAHVLKYEEHYSDVLARVHAME